jgi:hypothetical protein
MPLFEIDVIVTFRNKYVIEAKELSHAFDEIVMTEHDRNFSEITQKCLGEQILDGKEITQEQLITLMQRLQDDKDELCSYWMGDKLIHKIDYTK